MDSEIVYASVIVYISTDIIIAKKTPHRDTHKCDNHKCGNTVENKIFVERYSHKSVDDISSFFWFIES